MCFLYVLVHLSCLEYLLLYQYFINTRQPEKASLRLCNWAHDAEHIWNILWMPLRSLFNLEWNIAELCYKRFWKSFEEKKKGIYLGVLLWRGNGFIWIKDLKMSTSQPFLGAIISQQPMVKMICFLRCLSLFDSPKCLVLAIFFRSKESMMRSIHQTLQFKTQNQ